MRSYAMNCEMCWRPMLMRSTSHARVEQGKGNVAIAVCDESTHSTVQRSRRGRKEYREVLWSTAVVFGVLTAGCFDVGGTKGSRTPSSHHGLTVTCWPRRPPRRSRLPGLIFPNKEAPNPSRSPLPQIEYTLHITMGPMARGGRPDQMQLVGNSA